MVQAALPAVATAFAMQKKPEKPIRQKLPSRVPDISLAKDRKQAKIIRDQAREEMLYDFITQPEVLGWLMTIGGILAVQNIPFSKDKFLNESIQATATSATVIMGMGQAGVGDLTTAVIAISGGLASFLGGILGGDGVLPDINVLGDRTLPGLTSEETKSTILRSTWPWTIQSWLNILK